MGKRHHPHPPAERITALAKEIGQAKPCFICQGLGMQRHANGDNASRAVMALALMVGQVGRPGTTSGGTIGNSGIGLRSLPTGTNPVKTKIPQFLWPEAIRDGAKLTATHDGIQGADALKTGIKFLVNYGNNMMANQNADINTTTDILRDESLCEFILQYDVAWTDSCNWADIVLPDLTPQETYSLTAAGESNDVAGIRFGQPVCEPKFERREIYEVCGELAKRLGVYDEYSNGGMTREDWCRKLYDDLVEKAGDKYDMPTYDEGVKMGTFTFDIAPSDKIDPFIADPEANPLKTKNRQSADLLARVRRVRRDVDARCRREKRHHAAADLRARPDSAEDVTDEFPFQILDFHPKCTTHSTYAHNPVLNRITPFQAWINPIDAEKMGIADLDRVKLTSAQGSMITQAKVTNRVMPGVIMHPQGAWHDAPAEGDRTDKGGCTNTLTSRQRNPVSKGTGQHSVIGTIERVKESKPMTQYGFYFDATRCTGCHTCEAACRDYHDLGLDFTFRHVYEIEGGGWNQASDGTWSTDSYTYYVSTSCQHCDNPACTHVCPTGRHAQRRRRHRQRRRQEMHRLRLLRAGLPLWQPGRSTAKKGHSTKCDGCASRLAEGKSPICVEACTMRALHWPCRRDGEARRARGHRALARPGEHHAESVRQGLRARQAERLDRIASSLIPRR